MSTYEAPQVGDTLIVRYTADYCPDSIGTVLEIEQIPPEETVNPDVPRWAMWVEDPDGRKHYWPGMGPGDFEWARP